MSLLPAGGEEREPPHTLTITLGDFAYALLREEAARQRVPIEELAAHAIVYYLADADAGRVAWPVPRAPGDT
jgi:hypothetical protein